MKTRRLSDSTDVLCCYTWKTGTPSKALPASPALALVCNQNNGKQRHRYQFKKQVIQQDRKSLAYE